MRSALVATALFITAAAQPQTRIIGEVTAKDQAADRLTIRADSGKTTAITVDPKTSYLRIGPGETNLSNATTVAFSDISTGDRVLALVSAESGSAIRVVLMSKADIEQKRTAEQEDWRKRGHAGTITAIEPSSKKFAVASRSVAGKKTFMVETAENTRYRRYAPDSVRFGDAKPSDYGDLKVGDQVRVLGDLQGATVHAEMIVSGQFRNIAGTVESVDPAAGEVRIVDLATKQPLIVKTGPDSLMRRMPEEAAKMMSQRRVMGDTGEQRRSRTAAAPADGVNGEAADIQQMLERMPRLLVNELKPGEAVIVTSTEGSERGRVTAIALIAGVEPLLREPARPADSRLGGDWNFDINIMP